MAEFGRCPTCDSPQPSTHPVVSRSVGGKITGLCPDPFHALRPESDLLDLVRQYGDRRATEIAGRGAIAAHARAEAETLFARIEVEVQRLRDDRDDLQKLFNLQYDRTAEAVEIWRSEAPEERANVLLPDFGTLVTWLLRRVGEQGRESLVASAELADMAKQRDEALAEVERLKGNADQWFLIAINTAKRASTLPDPLVLTLPQVPEGATLIGARTAWRYKLDGDLWRSPADDLGGIVDTLGEIFDREGSVTVEMAPPREPRTKIGDKIKRHADKVPADVKQFVDQRYLRVWSQHPADPAGSWGSAQPSVAWGERHLLDECAPLVVTEVFDT